MMDKILIKEIIAPIFIVLIGFLIYSIIKKAIKKMFEIKTKKEKNNRYNTIAAIVRNIFKYLIILICFVMILDVFGIDTKSIVASVGVVGVVAGLALQDFLKDFIAGMTIIFENQYAIGDVVTISGFKGTVTGFTLKTTRIKAWTGEEKIIANHLVTDIINYNHFNSLAIVDVSISYDENLDKVEKVLNQLCSELNGTLENLTSDITVLGIEELSSSSIVYRISAEVKSGEQFNIQRQLRKYIKQGLDKNKIEIPYNQLVIHNG